MRVAAFDFDGTLHRGDSLVGFLRETASYKRLCFSAAQLLLGVLKRKSRSELKLEMLGQLYRGSTIEELDYIGHSYADKAVSKLNTEVLERLEYHKSMKHRVLIVSASPSWYLSHVATQLGVEIVCTEAAYENDVFMGEFATPNCQGAEKVKRLKALGIQGENLTAYGNSDGDIPMLEYASEASMVGRSGIEAF